MIVNNGFKQAGSLPEEFMDSEDGRQMVEYLLSIEHDNLVPFNDYLRLKSSSSGRYNNMGIINK